MKRFLSNALVPLYIFLIQCGTMQRPAMPPRLERKGPTLDTLHMIESVLRKSHEPLSLNRIKILLPRKVMHATLREAVEHYKRLGCVTEGSKGVLWTLNAEPEFWKVVGTWGAPLSWPRSPPARFGWDSVRVPPRQSFRRNCAGGSCGGLHG